eukprot:4840752-Amphidinium_carterae.1
MSTSVWEESMTYKMLCYMVPAGHVEPQPADLYRGRNPSLAEEGMPSTRRESQVAPMAHPHQPPKMSQGWCVHRAASSQASHCQGWMAVTDCSFG